MSFMLEKFPVPLIVFKFPGSTQPFLIVPLFVKLDEELTLNSYALLLKSISAPNSISKFLQEAVIVCCFCYYITTLYCNIIEEPGIPFGDQEEAVCQSPPPVPLEKYWLFIDIEFKIIQNKEFFHVQN